MKKFSILLVDDIYENIYSLKMLIEDGFDVHIFSALNVKDAITILMNNPIDLILTDIQMPNIDGFEFVELLKSEEKTKNIPIIFITGIYDKDEYKTRGFDLGAIDYITKPINYVLLNAKLKIYIDIFRNKKIQEAIIDEKNSLLINQSKFIAMGEMISMIAHQWRQPLTTLGLVLDRMNLLNNMNKLTPEAFKENYSKGSDLIQHMSQTIEDFRNFYKNEQTENNTTVKSIIDSSINLISPAFIENGIIHTIFISEETKKLEFSINTSKICQVLLNLYKNSMDEFISKKIENPIIKISCFNNNEFIMIEISDNAGGIPKKYINKVFEPYFSTKSKNGTGLGLYMSKIIIEEQMKGFISFKNEKNGVCFSLMLPIQ